MRAHSDRAKPAGRRFSARVPHLGAGDIRQWLGKPRTKVTMMGAVLAVVVAATAVLAGSRRESGLLSSGSASAAAPTAATTPLPPTRLLALPSHTIADGTQPLTVTLSATPASSSPPPTLRPAVAGTWATVGNSAVFTPASTLQPCSTYTLTVWGNTIATGHSRLGRRQTIGLNVACPPIAGLQQALARLGYMGAVFHPRYDVHIAPGPETRREAAEHAFHPPRGALVPDPSEAPAIEAGHLDETTKGALTVYQSDRGLEATGEPGYATWASLLASETAYRRDPRPYTWVTVSESSPETLDVHVGDRVAFSTPANTGVPGAETAQGIFPIFSRLTSTTMTGEDVDGTKYKVEDVPWVNYFNGGDAVHGYERGSYGFPQSNGCVELPIAAAHTVYGMLALGDIVDVEG
jgi:peptidoglycan hydrolase-like protein with peptidoglycan-binding domain